MFKKASDYKNDKLSIVVFGEPGVGKTSLAKTIPGKVLIVDAEKGLQSINDSDITAFPLYEDLEGNYLPRTRRFGKLKWLLEKIKNGELEQKFDWIVVDSITEVSQNLVEQVKFEEEEKQKAGDKINSFEKWGKYNDEITMLLKDLRDMNDLNVVCLALVDESKNSDGTKDKELDMQGKISQKLPGLFDEVFYMHRNNDNKRVLVTDNFKNIICKDRSGKLDQFEPADIGHIANKIRN